MALIVKKDIGFGETYDAYISLDVSWRSSSKSWEIDVKAWPSKKAREFQLIQDWISFRAEDVSVEIPYNESFANEFNISRENWNAQMSPGPWDNVEDIRHIRETYVIRAINLAQEYKFFFYEKDNIKELPKTIDTKNVLKHFYKSVKNPSSRLFDAIDSKIIENKEITKSIKDELETKKEVVLRWAKEDPLLTLKAPSESVLIWPPGWE